MSITIRKLKDICEKAVENGCGDYTIETQKGFVKNGEVMYMRKVATPGKPHGTTSVDTDEYVIVIDHELEKMEIIRVESEVINE